MRNLLMVGLTVRALVVWSGRFADDRKITEKRRELQHRGLSFADMAIEIGKLWRELPENEKREAQARAIKARDDYKEALAAYKTTEEHRRYEMYLKEWKARKCARKTSKCPRSARDLYPCSSTYLFDVNAYALFLTSNLRCCGKFQYERIQYDRSERWRFGINLPEY